MADDIEEDWRALRGHRGAETLGDRYGAAMEVQTPEDAQRIFERLVTTSMTAGNRTREAAERLERQNLGYYSGYYNLETQRRVERLFSAAHPVFGPTSGPQLTADEVVRAGVRAGERSRRSESPIFCEHANEMPGTCPCPSDCYCKFNSCRTR